MSNISLANPGQELSAARAQMQRSEECLLVVQRCKSMLEEHLDMIETPTPKPQMIDVDREFWVHKDSITNVEQQNSLVTEHNLMRKQIQNAKTRLLILHVNDQVDDLLKMVQDSDPHMFYNLEEQVENLRSKVYLPSESLSVLKAMYDGSLKQHQEWLEQTVRACKKAKTVSPYDNGIETFTIEDFALPLVYGSQQPEHCLDQASEAVPIGN